MENKDKLIQEMGELKQRISILEKAEIRYEEIAKQLLESEEKFRMLFENAGEGLLYLNAKGTILDVNPKVEIIAGASRQELIGKHITQLIPIFKINRKTLLQAFQEIITGTPLRNTEWSITSKMGKPITVLAHPSVIRRDGKIIGLSVILEDITKRKQAEEDIRTMNEYFNQLFESAQEGIILAEIDGRVIHANREFLRLFGFQLENIQGKYIDSIIATNEYIDEAKMITKNASHGQRTRIETKRVRSDGTTICVSILASPIIIKNRQVAVYAIYRDITDRKKVLEDLKQSYERSVTILKATVNTLALAAEKRDPYTAGHQQRVAQLSLAIAKEMGFSQDKIDGLYLAAIIHDIGKIHIPAEILTKPTTLTDLEFNIMKTHAQVGYDILKHIDFPWPIAQIVLQHHERINGSGYPNELRGSQILFEARLLAVADVIEAMSTHRPYRPAKTLDATLIEIKRNKGILYDPDVVDICISLFTKKSFTFNPIHQI